MSQFNRRYLRLSPKVVLKRVSEAQLPTATIIKLRADDGITIPQPRVRKPTPEIEAERMREYLRNCAATGALSFTENPSAGARCLAIVFIYLVALVTLIGGIIHYVHQS